MGKPTRLYGEISKTEKQDDGTLMVYGYASAEVVDSDGEIVTADAMKAARDGYMAFANVREMHDPKKAAGVAVEYDVQEDGRTWFGAHVVDPVAVLKCETGVYKGFSIGAKVPKGGRDGKVIKSIELREVSLVDRPANPEAVFTLVKAEGGADDDTSDSEGGEQIQKGLWEVGQFGEFLRQIGYLAASAEWEAQAEADRSPLPAAMRQWLADGLTLFQAMATEESNELIAQLAAMATPAPDTAAVFNASAAGGDLAKAGARFSKTTKAALSAAHEAVRACDKALADLGYDKSDDADEDDAAGKAATAEDLQKAAQATQEAEEALAKARQVEQDQIGEIAKAAGLEIAEPTQDALTKAAITELVKVRGELEALKASPAAPKGALNATVALSKAADVSGGQTNEPEPVVKADGQVDEVATLVKAAQARPIRL